MSKASSIRLLEAQFLQSDIGFKRIVGFQEFELGGRERGSGTGMTMLFQLSFSTNLIFLVITYCRVYLNRQTAAAHHFIFKKIEQIVKEDTGKNLQWRHLHSQHIHEFTGILHWAADQHGGQAKGDVQLVTISSYNTNLTIPLGLGLHLKELAQGLPHKFDLHEPHRLLASLSEYEHLHRLIRLCHAHVARNIKVCKVSESVKTKMRSLVCVTHPDFEGTLTQIELEGGKEGAGMSSILLVVSTFLNADDWHRLGARQETVSICPSRDLLAEESHPQAHMADGGLYQQYHREPPC